jgi:hypothetical protein
MKCSQCWLPASIEGDCRACYKKNMGLRIQEVLKSMCLEEDVDPARWAPLTGYQQAAILLFAYAYNYPARYHFSRTSAAWPWFLMRVKEHRAGDLCCKGFRAVLRKGLYKEGIFPEGCAGCALALYLSSPEAYLLPMLDIYIYRSRDYHLFFKNNGKPGVQKDEMLSFVHELLWIPKETLFFEEADADEKRKSILLALKESVHHGDYLLEELVLRPENYPFLLANPPTVQECYLELVYEDPEKRWAFCSRVRDKFVKRVEMRCRIFKEELMEKTWDPSRVIPWCFSQDEKESVRGFKG